MFEISPFGTEHISLSLEISPSTLPSYSCVILNVRVVSFFSLSLSEIIHLLFYFLRSFLGPDGLRSRANAISKSCWNVSRRGRGGRSLVAVGEIEFSPLTRYKVTRQILQPSFPTFIAEMALGASFRRDLAVDDRDERLLDPQDFRFPLDFRPRSGPSIFDFDRYFIARTIDFSFPIPCRDRRFLRFRYFSREERYKKSVINLGNYPRANLVGKGNLSRIFYSRNSMVFF